MTKLLRRAAGRIPARRVRAILRRAELSNTRADARYAR